MRDAYLATVSALRRRELPTYDVSSRVRLTKTPAQYLASPRRPARAGLRGDARERADRRGRSASGSASTAPRDGRGGVIAEPDRTTGCAATADPRDYDVDHYVRILRDSSRRGSRARLTPDDYAAVFADPDQLTLFARSLADADRS